MRSQESGRRSRYQWILFDADGTLFDFEQAELSALQKTFTVARHEYHPDYAPTYRRVNKEIWAQLERSEVSPEELKTLRFQRFFESMDINLDAAWFSEEYLRQLATCTELIDGADQVLAAVDGHVRLALITNGLKDVQRPRLARSSIGHYFEVVIISEEVGVAKPDPAIFAWAFTQMGDPAKADVLVVGDSLSSDIRGGNNYGIDTCWFNPNGAGKHHDVQISYEIDRLSELIDLLFTA